MSCANSGMPSGARFIVLRSKAARQVASNKNVGAYFERMFAYRARCSGVLAVRNELSFKWLAQGKILPIRTNLDFTLILPDGRHAYCDCKSFDKEHLTLSMLDKHQLARAVAYAKWSVPAGFVVWFKPLGVVSFFTGVQLAEVKARARVLPSDGVPLGSFSGFSLLPVFNS